MCPYPYKISEAEYYNKTLSQCDPLQPTCEYYNPDVPQMMNSLRNDQSKLKSNTLNTSNTSNIEQFDNSKNVLYNNINSMVTKTDPRVNIWRQESPKDNGFLVQCGCTKEAVLY
jgi:hypothetical protein